MKNLIIVFFISGMANLSFGQESLAMITKSDLNTRTSKSTKVQNTQYLNARKYVAPTLATSIKRLQNVAANYDITEDRVYSSTNKKITYTVVFESNANYIKAIYNYDGTILESEEFYEDVRIPYSLGSEIAKAYPGWSFNNSDCIVEYVQNEATRYTYSFVLKNGTKSKRVKRTLLSPLNIVGLSAGN
ncbi:hypothetical protein [Flagellimonas sp. GZD32]|uniref:hypothetical protein n=1 Tax=Flagellimonas cixiensis TaxID=3228750 RepID=UPI0035C8BA77